MYSELIIVLSTGKQDTDKVWRTMESSPGGELLVMSDVALIQRDSQGKSAFQMRWQKAEYSSERQRRLAGALAEAIFGTSRMEGQRQLSEAGVDPLFIQDVDQALKPGCSAYLIHVSRESQIDTQRYLEILGRLPGNLYHSIFPAKAEEVLLIQKG